MSPRVIFVLIMVTVIFVIATIGAGKHEISASTAVNRGCATHKGIERWGGSNSYSATCRDGYAFTGSDEWHWEWPWW